MTIVSVDIETDGPIPGQNSMLSIGAYATDGDFTKSHYVKLYELDGAHPDPDTLEWWAKQDRAVWDELHTDRVQPVDGIRGFVAWLTTLPGDVKMMCSPAGFDFTFLRYYCVRFTGNGGATTPFFNCIDLRSVAMPLRGMRYGGNLKKDLREIGITSEVRHTHNALDDAMEQADLYLQVIDRLKRKEC